MDEELRQYLFRPRDEKTGIVEISSWPLSSREPAACGEITKLGYRAGFIEAMFDLENTSKK
jgi:hypothetical protein